MIPLQLSVHTRFRFYYKPRFHFKNQIILKAIEFYLYPGRWDENIFYSSQVRPVISSDAESNVLNSSIILGGCTEKTGNRSVHGKNQPRQFPGFIR